MVRAGGLDCGLLAGRGHLQSAGQLGGGRPPGWERGRTGENVTGQSGGPGVL